MKRNERWRKKNGPTDKTTCTQSNISKEEFKHLTLCFNRCYLLLLWSWLYWEKKTEVQRRLLTFQASFIKKLQKKTDYLLRLLYGYNQKKTKDADCDTKKNHLSWDPTKKFKLLQSWKIVLRKWLQTERQVKPSTITISGEQKFNTDEILLLLKNLGEKENNED